jgi:hypothetical protein
LQAFKSSFPYGLILNLLTTTLLNVNGDVSVVVLPGNLLDAGVMTLTIIPSFDFLVLLRMVVALIAAAADFDLVVECLMADFLMKATCPKCLIEFKLIQGGPLCKARQQYESCCEESLVVPSRMLQKKNHSFLNNSCQ